MPEDTIHAFAGHGRPALTLTRDVEAARSLMARLADAGLDVGALTRDLQAEGVDKFIQSYENALKAIKDRSQSVGVR
jgi:transaldolase